MLPQVATAPQLPSRPCTRIGVGIDTSRYGHYAVFLRQDQSAAAAELQFVESAAGYAQLRQRLDDIIAKHGHVHFHVRLDAAGQYADNLLHFLRSLAGAWPCATFTLSCGDPQRNKNYRAAVFGAKKSDPIEARAAARYALTEQPAPAHVLSDAMRTLRQIASRLQAVSRQRTRLINQLHHLLALTFPELALLVKDISLGWILELCYRYPTAKLLARASADDLGAIPYLPHEHIDGLLAHARTSVASLDQDAVAELVRDQVRQLRDARARQLRLEKTMVDAYHALPDANHLGTIPGIGDVTAAVLTAFILDIERFDTPTKLVAYFGVMPIEVGSGVDRDGNPRPSRRYIMCRRGNDLVRRYLWMAALSAVRHNPAVRALYARVVQKHPEHKGVAIGHAMRKLLHLVFALWKSGKPFDKENYPWDTPAHVALPSALPVSASHSGDAQTEAAGLTLVEPATKEVTAASSVSTTSLPPDEAVAMRITIDFAHLKKQLPIARVLEHLGLTSKLRGSGAQKRCACPIHRADGRGRTFSVHLERNVFHCFEASCQKKGDVIDLWATLNGLDLRAAALDLVRTFDLEVTATEKRNG